MQIPTGSEVDLSLLEVESVRVSDERILVVDLAGESNHYFFALSVSHINRVDESLYFNDFTQHLVF